MQDHSFGWASRGHTPGCVLSRGDGNCAVRMRSRALRLCYAFIQLRADCAERVQRIDGQHLRAKHMALLAGSRTSLACAPDTFASYHAACICPHLRRLFKDLGATNGQQGQQSLEGPGLLAAKYCVDCLSENSRSPLIELTASGPMPGKGEARHLDSQEVQLSQRCCSHEAFRMSAYHCYVQSVESLLPSDGVVVFQTIHAPYRSNDSLKAVKRPRISILCRG